MCPHRSRQLLPSVHAPRAWGRFQARPRLWMLLVAQKPHGPPESWTLAVAGTTVRPWKPRTSTEAKKLAALLPWTAQVHPLFRGTPSCGPQQGSRRQVPRRDRPRRRGPRSLQPPSRVPADVLAGARTRRMRRLPELSRRAWSEAKQSAESWWLKHPQFSTKGKHTE